MPSIAETEVTKPAEDPQPAEDTSITRGHERSSSCDSSNAGSSLLDEINRQTEVVLQRKLSAVDDDDFQIGTVEITDPPSSTVTNATSHVQYLLLSNAKRRHELDEERRRFEKEKAREKEKKRVKKLFFRLSKRVREKMATTTRMTTSVIVENEIAGSSEAAAAEFCHHPSSDSTHSPETSEDQIQRLERELSDARRIAAQREAQCEHLRKMQKSLDNEVQDLTESLFQEAYRLANIAESRKEQAEKLLAEALLKVDLLQAEVKALKEVIKPAKRTIRERFSSSQRKSESMNGISKKLVDDPFASTAADLNGHFRDPTVFSEFLQWLEAPDKREPTHPFIRRLMAEDVAPCFSFGNADLAQDVLAAIHENTLEMEPFLPIDSVKECALTGVFGRCPYRLRTSTAGEWIFVSMFARNRVAAVADLFTYLRYVQYGIVKAPPADSFLMVTTMRRSIALARLGLDEGLHNDESPA